MAHRYGADWGAFERSLPSREGVQVLICPKCEKTVRHYKVRVNGLNDYAFREQRFTDENGKSYPANYDFDGRGCCFPG